MCVSQIAGVTSAPGGSVARRPQLFSQASPGERDHRARRRDSAIAARRYVLVAGVQLGPQALQGRGVAQKQVEGPGQPGRRRLVPREQQRHELVAKLGVAHLLAVLEAGPDEHREDVLAVREVRVLAPLGDLGGQELVDLGGAPRSSPSGSGPAEPPGEHDPQLQHRRCGLGEQVAEQRGRSRPMRAGSLTPKTARMITSSVSACIRGCIAKLAADGQLSISRGRAPR